MSPWLADTGEDYNYMLDEITEIIPREVLDPILKKRLENVSTKMVKQRNANARLPEFLPGDLVLICSKKRTKGSARFTMKAQVMDGPFPNGNYQVYWITEGQIKKNKPGTESQVHARYMKKFISNENPPSLLFGSTFATPQRNTGSNFRNEEGAGEEGGNEDENLGGNGPIEVDETAIRESPSVSSTPSIEISPPRSEPSFTPPTSLPSRKRRRLRKKPEEGTQTPIPKRPSLYEQMKQVVLDASSPEVSLKRRDRRK